jgi:ATP-dependent DNA ligase
MGIER